MSYRHLPVCGAGAWFQAHIWGSFLKVASLKSVSFREKKKYLELKYYLGDYSFLMLLLQMCTCAVILKLMLSLRGKIPNLFNSLLFPKWEDLNTSSLLPFQEIQFSFVALELFWGGKLLDHAVFLKVEYSLHCSWCKTLDNSVETPSSLQFTILCLKSCVCVYVYIVVGRYRWCSVQVQWQQSSQHIAGYPCTSES